MGGTAMRGRFGKERNLPGSGVECPGMRWACGTEPVTHCGCARGRHKSSDMDDIRDWYMDGMCAARPVSTSRLYRD